MSTEIDRYDAMCSAIAECVRVGQAKDIRDKAKALQDYSRQAGNHEAERQCAIIRARAERRCGELLKAMAESGERATQDTGRPEKVSPLVTLIEKPETLESLHISRMQSSRWQLIAEIPDAVFEKAIQNAIPTTRGLVDIAKEARRCRKRREHGDS